MTNIPLVIARISGNQFKCTYLRNKFFFSSFLLHFSNLRQNLIILQKNMALIAYVFPKLETKKQVVSQMSKKPRFRTTFDSQHVKGSKHCLNLHRNTFIMFFSQIWMQLRRIHKNFSQSFAAFLKFTSNFVQFGKTRWSP